MHPTSDTGPGSNSDRSFPTPEGKILLTVEEAAARLSLGRTSVFAMVKSGELRSLKVGKARRIVAESLHTWVADKLADAS